MKYSINFFAFAIVLVSLSCKDTKEKLPIVTPSLKEGKKNDTRSKAAQKGPIINIIDTLEINRIVLCVKDSALSIDRMKEKLSNIFNKTLPEGILMMNLQATREQIVWYKTTMASYFFEAGIPVDKKVASLRKGMFMKKTGGDSALIAHFFGPTELIYVAYDALNERLKENNKKKTTPSYEIYKDNNFLNTTPNIDPYKLQIDIVMPYK